jgi:hypothetical protein
MSHSALKFTLKPLPMPTLRHGCHCILGGEDARVLNLVQAIARLVGRQA